MALLDVDTGQQMESENMLEALVEDLSLLAKNDFHQDPVFDLAVKAERTKLLCAQLLSTVRQR